jgi:hypothetical protein
MAGAGISERMCCEVPMNNVATSTKVIIVLFGIIALISLVLGVNDYVHQEAWFAHAEQAQGTITAYDLHVRNDGKSEYCPRIEFTTRDGQPGTGYGDSCPSKPDKSRIGQLVTLYYDPNDPADTRSKGWVGVEGSGLIIGLIGFVFFLALAAIIYWVDGRRTTARSLPGTGGLNATLLQDAQRYRANQLAAEKKRKKPGAK